jgi:hypothetical protein
VGRRLRPSGLWVGPTDHLSSAIKDSRALGSTCSKPREGIGCLGSSSKGTSRRCSVSGSEQTAINVREGAPRSHRSMGWETFTDEVIRVVTANSLPGVFILWGKDAQRKKELVDSPPHTIVEVAAPGAPIRPQRLLRESAVQPGEPSPRCRQGGEKSTGSSRSNAHGIPSQHPCEPII